jgi:hypothetical protein
MLYGRPVRELLVDAVGDMPSMFRRADVVEWFRTRYPAVKHNTVTTNITAATVNSRSRQHYPALAQHLIYKRDDGLLERYSARRHGQWDTHGELISGAALAEPALIQPPILQTPSVKSGHQFEHYARTVCSKHWGVDLKSAVVEVTSGVPHQFDLVSPDRRIVGDAKWFKNLATPAAKWSVIAEYVWLLQHLVGAQTRFIVFGQDREVPVRWLKRFGPLATDIEFYFLPSNGIEITPL